MHFKFLKRMIKRLAKSKIAGDQIGCGGRGTMVVLNTLPQFLEKKKLIFITKKNSPVMANPGKIF